MHLSEEYASSRPVEGVSYRVGNRSHRTSVYTAFAPWASQALGTVERNQ